MPADKNADENRKIIEAALFIAARPMSLAELYNIVNIPKPEIKKILESMKPHYDDHGVRLVERDEHYELQIKDAYVKHVEHLAPERDFSRATMQTLSLIAFRSPVKQSEIVEIRGNRAYDHVKELLSKGLIRSEPQGHTNMLHIT
ncbi:MAG: SMC-Scp complex subunit ScpB, partial [Candidatus Aenigmarchaeota archaeon]|nr:SMC-Scp complex subunit ScpB [Candidatus Aenigmarchaeota archaeon]